MPEEKSTTIEPPQTPKDPKSYSERIPPPRKSKPAKGTGQKADAHGKQK